MKYMGGKSRIAKQIADYILAYTYNMRESNLTLVSLFCGACSIECNLAKYFDKVICNDNHKYLIALLNAVNNGWIPPDYLSEEEWYYVKDHLDQNPALSGFAGFGCSFGGRWFEGYARGKKSNGDPRNYAAEAKKSLLRDIAPLDNVKFICGDYHDVILPDGCVVYADPPYANTKQISRQNFDTESFWNYMREISKNRIVFISEQSAPEDFVSVWEQKLTRTLDRNKNNQFKATEHLFLHNSKILNNY